MGSRDLLELIIVEAMSRKMDDPTVEAVHFVPENWLIALEGNSANFLDLNES